MLTHDLSIRDLLACHRVVCSVTATNDVHVEIEPVLGGTDHVFSSIDSPTSYMTG